MASKSTPPDEAPSAPVAYRERAFISRTLVMRDGFCSGLMIPDTHLTHSSFTHLCAWTFEVQIQ